MRWPRKIGQFAPGFSTSRQFSLVVERRTACSSGPCASISMPTSCGYGLDALFADDPLDMENRTGRRRRCRPLDDGGGLPALDGRFTGSPHMGLGLAPDGRDMRPGWRLTPEGPAAPDLSFDLAATRRNMASGSNGGPAPFPRTGFGTCRPRTRCSCLQSFRSCRAQSSRRMPATAWKRLPSSSRPSGGSGCGL